jgi:diguanylate cyclase (GGDEF)-like protein
MIIASRQAAVWTAILIVAGSIVTSVATAEIIAAIVNFEPAWQHYVFATCVPAIVVPLFAVPLVHMNYRLNLTKAEVERLAETDALTGIANRRAFFARAKELFAAADHSAQRAALLMVDVDRFKTINDTFGHDAGDHVLRAVAQELSRIVMLGQDAGPRTMGRIGGEEFAVAVKGIDYDGLCRLAERIRSAIQALTVHACGGTIGATVSVGAALRAPGQNVDAVLAMADQAVYAAKHAGRNRWRMAKPLPVPTPSFARDDIPLWPYAA